MSPIRVAHEVSYRGLRPTPTDGCPPSVAAIMRRCWDEAPSARPTFDELGAQLLEFSADSRYHTAELRLASALRESAAVRRPATVSFQQPDVTDQVWSTTATRGGTAGSVQHQQQHQ